MAIIVVMLSFCTVSLAATAPHIDAQATVDLPGIKAANEYTAVIQSSAELAKLLEADDAAAALTRANAALKTKDIDFDKQMLLVASPVPRAGETPAQIQVSGFVEQNGEWLVRWRITNFQLRNQTDLPARRGVLCLIERTKTAVKFLPPAQSGR